MCTTSKTVNYLLAWVILFFICPPLQCFFFNPFNALTQPQPIKAQPITFKVPKKKLKEVTELLKTNPDYLRELTVNPRDSKIPITFAPKGPINPTSNGYPTLPYGRYGTTTQLPEEIMINGQKHFKTTRASLMLNKAFGWLNSAIPAKTIPSIPYDVVNYNRNNNKPKQNEKEKVEDDSEYEYEYEDEDDEDDKKEKDKNNGNKKDNKTSDKKYANLEQSKGAKQNEKEKVDDDSIYEYVYEDEDDEVDIKKKENNHGDKKDNKKNDKKYANPEQSKVAKGNQKQSNKQQYEDSFESGEDLTDDDDDE